MNQEIFFHSSLRPKVSFVMAVKDGSKHIHSSIESILNQTFSDFELIIINDGSTDNTLEIINSFKDSRIFVFSQNNRGVALSANRGLALSRGQYIARQDHDDISLPERLAKQIDFLDKNADIYLLGTAAEIWGESGATGRIHDHPTDPEVLSKELLFDNPFVHSSVVFRREVLRDVGYYSADPDISPLDDYDFISRIAAKFKVANLKERLVIYRENPNSLTSDFRHPNRGSSSLEIKKIKIMSRNINFLLNSKVEMEEINFFAQIFAGPINFQKVKFNISQMQNILKKIYLFDVSGVRYSGNLCDYRIKLDHLNYWWYENPRVAGKLSCFIYFSKIRLIGLKYKVQVGINYQLANIKRTAVEKIFKKTKK